ncbi:putative periplasmic lipoprotein [Oceanobacillus manasiensis]|uniref:hypothetical protein n=1 Tax=Oceanobacillus manasiensis TaxID=586413 RepID=UPI0005A90873|nr:hypothetical protein [Oceanobacillus manasiensis]
MRLKLTFHLVIGISLLLSACGYSNTVEDTVYMDQEHVILKGVVTEINTDKEITVKDEASQVNLRVTENSSMINHLEDVIHFKDLEKELEVSVSWFTKKGEGKNVLELEKLEILD